MNERHVGNKIMSFVLDIPTYDDVDREHVAIVKLFAKSFNLFYM